jgi:hypothetical protein
VKNEYKLYVIQNKIAAVTTAALQCPEVHHQQQQQQMGKVGEKSLFFMTTFQFFVLLRSYLRSLVL